MTYLVYDRKLMNHDRVASSATNNVTLPSFWLSALIGIGPVDTTPYQPEFKVGFLNLESVYGKEISSNTQSSGVPELVNEDSVRGTVRVALYENSTEKEIQSSVGLRSVSVGKKNSSSVYSAECFCSSLTISALRQLCDFMGLEYPDLTGKESVDIKDVARILSYLELKDGEEVKNVQQLRDYLSSRCCVSIKVEVNQSEQSFSSCIKELCDLFRSKVSIRMALMCENNHSTPKATRYSAPNNITLHLAALMEDKSIPTHLNSLRKESFLSFATKDLVQDEANAIFLLERFCVYYIENKIDCAITYDNFFDLEKNSGMRKIAQTVVEMCKSVLPENEFVRTSNRTATVSQIINWVVEMTCNEKSKSGFESYFNQNSIKLSKAGWPFLDTVLTVVRSGISVDGGIEACYMFLFRLSNLVKNVNEYREKPKQVAVADFHNARWWKHFIIDVAKAVGGSIMSRVREEWAANRNKERTVRNKDRTVRCPFQIPFAFALEAYLEKCILECIVEFGLSPDVPSCNEKSGFARYIQCVMFHGGCLFGCYSIVFYIF